MTIPPKNYVGGSENINEYWSPMETEVSEANLNLRALFNQLISKKIYKIENVKKDSV